MYIARILYPVKNLGPGDRLGIWVSGCSRNCLGCANPELHKQLPEQQISLDGFKKIVYMLPELPKALTITGGEPFDQANELASLCNWFSSTVSKDIFIYTGYTLQQLKDTDDENVKSVLSHIAALVDGEYIQELNMGNKIKGSENQKLFVFREEYRKIFTSLDNTTVANRIVQPFVGSDGSIIVTGFEKSNFSSDFSEALQAAIDGGYVYEKT